MLRGLMTTAWLAVAFFLGVPAALFAAIWFLSLRRDTMRRLVIGLAIAVFLAVLLATALQPRAQAAMLMMPSHAVRARLADPPSSDVVIDVCSWCWWCLECLFGFVEPPGNPTTVDWEIQQTFNPF